MHGMSSEQRKGSMCCNFDQQTAPQPLHTVKSFKMPSLSGFTKGPTLPPWVGGGCLSICVPVRLFLGRSENPGILEGGRHLAETLEPEEDPILGALATRGRPCDQLSGEEAVSRAAVLQARSAQNPAYAPRNARCGCSFSPR